MAAERKCRARVFFPRARGFFRRARRDQGLSRHAGTGIARSENPPARASPGRLRTRAPAFTIAPTRSTPPDRESNRGLNEHLPSPSLREKAFSLSDCVFSSSRRRLTLPSPLASFRLLNPQQLLVDFTASWCGPCKMIGPYFEELAGKFPGVVFVKVDVDDLDDVAAECGISAMPTFQLYSNGVKVEELTGADKGKLEALAKTADDL
jgi:thioredoxin 1